MPYPDDSLPQSSRPPSTHAHGLTLSRGGQLAGTSSSLSCMMRAHSTWVLERPAHARSPASICEGNQEGAGQLEQ